MGGVAAIGVCAARPESYAGIAIENEHAHGAASAARNG